MSTPGALREYLADARAEGLGFAAVWPPAVERATAGQPAHEAARWSVALEATRPAWEDAYEGRPVERQHLAVAALADDEREPDDGLGRACERCHGAIAPTVKGTARFCTRRCQQAAANRRSALAAA